MESSCQCELADLTDESSLGFIQANTWLHEHVVSKAWRRASWLNVTVLTKLNSRKTCNVQGTKSDATDGTHLEVWSAESIVGEVEGCIALHTGQPVQEGKGSQGALELLWGLGYLILKDLVRSGFHVGPAQRHNQVQVGIKGCVGCCCSCLA